MEEKVEEIGTKWDNWIENNGLECLSDRRKTIQSQIEKLLVEIDADENLKDIKKLVLKAKLITVYPEYRSVFAISAKIGLRQGSTDGQIPEPVGPNRSEFFKIVLVYVWS